MEVLRKVKFNGGGATHRLNKCFSAFTLAEMMVVMLIMSIVLAAMAPVMTTKNKVDNSSPWKYSPNNSSDAYFGQGASMRAMIGQLNGEDTDNGKLIINSLGSSFSHILFKNGNTILGDLYLNGTSLVLGNRRGNNPIGSENINIGHDNWPAGTITGSSNITIGDASMTSLTTGSHNIGLGTTLTSVTTGEHNIGIGDDSLTNITGDGNIAIGGNANPNTASASKTIAIGTNSVASSIGAIAIGSNLTSSEAHGAELNAAQARVMNSIAIGNGATSGANSGGGQNSIAIGNQAKANSTSDSGSSGIAIGAYSNAGSASVAVGTSALAANTTGYYNNAIGYYSLADNTTGYDNTAVGNVALRSNTTGSGNIAIGKNTLYRNTRGDDNIAIGRNALYQSDTGGGNIAIGYQAMYYQNDINYGNTAVGYQAMVGTNSASNYHNTAIGYRALNRAGNSAKSAGQNTAVGSGALENNVTGFGNTAIGVNALNAGRQGDYNTGLGYYACANVTGSHKTCIGASSGPASGSDWAKDDKERIFIGSRSKYNSAPAVLEVHNLNETSNFRNYGNKSDNATSVVINGNLIVKGRIVTNPEVWAKGYVYGYCALTMTSGSGQDYAYYRYCGPNEAENILDVIASDRRLKYVGKDNNDGLAKIKQLKVFNYVYKKDTTKTPHVGVIAQDLQKVFPHAVQKGKDGFLTIRMEDMFYAVINAIKELDAKITALQKENQELKQLVKQVQEDNKRLDQRLQKLEAKQK